MSRTTTLVTGGNGYLASWIVKGLLEEGHNVRITVRDKSKEDKYQYLFAIEQRTPGNLSVYEADLLKNGSFDEAVSGCEYIFHTASPFFITGIKDPNLDLVRPAKDGTRNVLSSVNNARSVRRVIVTSSVAAIYGDNRDLLGKPAFTEELWNETSTAKHQPYSYSKTVAEKEAWKMAQEQNSWELVTINPSFLLGPSLSKRTDSTSISTLIDLLTGKYKTGVPHLVNGIVDVRDVAQAHLLAAFNPNASGRYLISNTEASLLDLARLLEKKFPGQYPLPKREVPKALMWLVAPTIGFSRGFVAKNVGHPIKFDNSKSVKELGMTYRLLENTLVDQRNQLKQDGLIG